MNLSGFSEIAVPCRSEPTNTNADELSFGRIPLFVDCQVYAASFVMWAHHGKCEHGRMAATVEGSNDGGNIQQSPDKMR
jgi:hypothetical protein